MVEQAFEQRDRQIDALIQIERDNAALYLRQCDALLELSDTTPHSRQVDTYAHLLAEAGTALHLHPQTIGARLHAAQCLRDLPLLRTLLLDGRLAVAHAHTACAELGDLNDLDLATRVLTDVVAREGRLGWTDTPAQLGRALRRAAIRLDPEGAARRRAEQTAARTGVRLRPLPDGLAALISTGQAPSIHSASQLLDVLSQPAGPHDTRSHGQRQIDALIAALAARAGTVPGLELQIEIPVQVTDTTDLGPNCLPEPLTIALDLSPDLLVLLAHAQQELAPEQPPREQPPVAPTPVVAGAREPDLRVGAAQDDDPTRDDTPHNHDEPTRNDEPHHRDEPTRDDRPTRHDEPHDRDEPTRDDEPHDRDEPTRDDRPTRDDEPHDRDEPTQNDKPTQNDETTARSHATAGGAPAPGASEPDRATPNTRTTRRRLRDGVPELLDHGPLDPQLITELLTHPEGLPVGLGPVHLRRVCVDPAGAVVALDPRSTPLEQLLHGTARRPLAPPDTAELLRRLTRHLPAPPPATASYQPTADQTRLVRARDRTCRFPGCARRARRSELDHRKRFQDDGPTSVENLHPLCKHHHRLKHDGWTCTRTPDGTTHWTSPRGRRTTVPL